MSEQEAKEIVLEYLKQQDRGPTITRREEPEPAPILLFRDFALDNFGRDLPEKVLLAYRSLSRKDDLEILAEFAAWGLEEGADLV